MALEDEDFGQVACYIDLLADRGVHLGERQATATRAPRDRLAWRAMQRCNAEGHLVEGDEV
jgi:hypothetical protein